MKEIYLLLGITILLLIRGIKGIINNNISKSVINDILIGILGFLTCLWYILGGDENLFVLFMGITFLIGSLHSIYYRKDINNSINHRINIFGLIIGIMLIIFYIFFVIYVK